MSRHVLSGFLFPNYWSHVYKTIVLNLISRFRRSNRGFSHISNVCVFGSIFWGKVFLKTVKKKIAYSEYTKSQQVSFFSGITVFLVSFRERVENWSFLFYVLLCFSFPNVFLCSFGRVCVCVMVGSTWFSSFSSKKETKVNQKSWKELKRAQESYWVLKRANES